MSSKLFIPNVAVNFTRKISLKNALRLPNTYNNDEPVEIRPPLSAQPSDYVITIRILSHTRLLGLEDSNKSEIYDDYRQIPEFTHDSQSLKKLSRFLLFHTHGGGFIAHSSKSHQVYLKPWCRQLEAPVVSVDYSLAPENPFPRASHEVFYVYAWCLLNRHLLGWTGERIICVGDSAGGNLATNVVQQAIRSQIRVPDALVPIYAPFLLAFSVSPSRLMSVMDPLLNMGILWRCLAAYCGIDANQVINREWNNLVEEDEFRYERFRKYQNVMGESIYLIEELRNHKLPLDELMSPLLSSDEMLRKFPKTVLIACNDPLLDDSIHMAKRLKQLHVNVELTVVDNGVSHGFLNLKVLGKETNNAFEVTVDCLKRIFAEFV